MIRRAFLAGLAATLVVAAPASAHIQVRPALAAPGDPVLFQLIVPNEKDAHTVEVTLQVPKDVLPFSFEEPAGWTRKNNLASDQSIETITWKGKLEQDGFASFQFLASTPDKEGDITWKAIQKYDDGSTVRWIGGADSDNPAAVTKVSESAPRENAGGEGEESSTGAAATPTPQATATAATVAATTTADDSDSPLPLILSAVAIALAVVALATARRSRR